MPYTRAQLINTPGFASNPAEKFYTTAEYAELGHDYLKLQPIGVAAMALVELFTVTRAAENAASWSCGELDAFTALLREIGTPAALALAKDFLEVHTEDDDEDERWNHA